MAKSRVTTYKGFKINETVDVDTQNQLFVVYTKEEWDYGEGFRTYEWEACTMQEAHDFVDSY